MDKHHEQAARTNSTNKQHEQTSRTSSTNKQHGQAPRTGSSDKQHEQTTCMSKQHEQAPQISTTNKQHEQAPRTNSTQHEQTARTSITSKHHGHNFVCFPSHCSNTGPAFHDSSWPPPRGWNILLSRYDWLIDTLSYFDWLVFYEAGKFARPIRLPPPGWAGALDWWKIKIHGFDWLS